jgi:hypothetical protein
MIIFVLATIGFIFTTEQQPESEEMLNEPRVHFYRKTRLNFYGYMMILSGASTAFIFYIASSNTSARLGFISLTLWFILILAANVMTYYISRVMFKDAVYDFLLMQIDSVNSYEKSKELSFILDAYLKIKNRKRKGLEKLLKDSGSFTKEETEVITELTLLYFQENLDPSDEVVSDEVKALNKENKKFKA